MGNTLEQPIAQGRTAEIYAWGEGRVLKLFRAGYARSACQHEFSIAQAVHHSGVPAPAVLAQTQLEGRHGIIYERLDGRTMLSALTEQPERLLEMAHKMADLHRQIHQCTAIGLPRWHDKFNQALSQAKLSDVQKSAIAQRAAALPEADKVCHGDFHPDNIVITPAGLRAVDWNNAFSGHPLADIAWTSLVFQAGEAPQGSDPQLTAMKMARATFLEAYLQRRLDTNLTALEAWLLPTAVLRLTDNIVEEREALLRVIDNALG